MMSLWGEELKETEQPEKSFSLKEPSARQRKACEAYFMNNYTVDELQKLCYKFIKLLTKFNTVIEVSGSSAKRAINYFPYLNKSSRKKAELVEIAAFFFAEHENLRTLVKSLSDDEIKVWRLLVQHIYANARLISTVTDEIWIKKEADSCFLYSYDIHRYLTLNASLFAASICRKEDPDYGYAFESEIYLSLPDSIRIAVAPMLFPEVKRIPDVVEELPDNKYIVFNGERDFVSKFSLVQALHSQGILVLKDDKMLVSTIKKAGKKLNLKEFFENNTTFDVFSNLRASMVLPAICVILDDSEIKIENKIERILSYVKNILGIYYFSFPILMPHIVGIKMSHLYESDIPYFVNDVFSILEKSTQRGWISVDDIKSSLLVYPNEQSCFNIIDIDTFDGIKLINKFTGKQIFLCDAFRQLSEAFLKGMLFMLGGFGLCELACRQPRKTDTSPYDALEYIRLTDLGRCCLNIDATYQPPQEDETQLFEIDDKRLLIHSLVEKNPYEALILDIAKPIGNKRYITNNQSFLQNCKNEDDVRQKISFFKRFISNGKESKIWNEFFDSILRQCYPLKKLNQQEYEIFQLDSSNKELINLLSTDKVLQKIVIRAEGYRIIVESGNVAKLKSHLKSYGYLI